MLPEQSDNPEREQIRLAVNDWIQTSGIEFVDFDEAIRSESTPARLAVEYNVGNHQHPNVNGQKRNRSDYGRSHCSVKSVEAKCWNRRGLNNAILLLAGGDRILLSIVIVVEFSDEAFYNSTFVCE